MKHHTLLHREKSLRANSLDKRIQSNAVSSETEKRITGAVVNNHCNASTEGQ